MEAAIITALGMLAIVLIERIFDNRRRREQLQKEREVDARERHRRVRDEPLLKLRVELARMATKNERLINYTQMLHTAIPAPPREELNRWIEQAREDLNDYIDKGELGHVLFTIDDEKIVDRVANLQRDYRMAFYRNTMFEKLPFEEQTQAINQSIKLAEQVREIQALINERLEKL